MTANPFNVCREAEAPTSAADQILYTTHLPSWAMGKVGTPRPVTPATDSGILSLLVAVMVLLGLNVQHVRRIFKSLPQDLLSVRRRNNAFDEHTANETRVIALLLGEMCVIEGLLLFIWLGRVDAGTTSQTVLFTVGALTALAAVYYFFQLAACTVLGYVFADGESAKIFRQGLNASQVILGLTLAVPALVSLFYPSMTSVMLVLAAVLFCAARVCYIVKGFRIFYINFSSLFYFILYLCTLEIIPVIILYVTASEICVKVQ